MKQLLKFAAVPFWKKGPVVFAKHFVTLEVISKEPISLEKKSKGWTFWCLASIFVREESSKHWFRNIDIPSPSYVDVGEWLQVLPVHSWHKIVILSSETFEFSD